MSTSGPPWPDPAELIPHRPPFLFVEAVVAFGDGEVVCRGVLPAADHEAGTCPAEVGSSAVAASPFLALEAAAQTAAVLAALAAGPGALGASAPAQPPGYLAAIHDARFLEPAIPCGHGLLLTARRGARMASLTRYTVSVALEEDRRLLATAILTTYSPASAGSS